MTGPSSTGQGGHGVCGLLASLLLLAVQLACTTGCRTVTGEFAFDADVPEPVEALAWARDKYDPDRRRTALKWLAHAPWASADVYISIYESLVEDPDPTVRAAALLALGRHGRPDHAVLVGLRLELDPSDMVRLQAARTLQRLHHEEAIASLQRAMQGDRDSWVRAEAAKALGQYPKREVLPTLVRALDDEKLEVAAGARRSLVSLTGRDFGYGTEEWQSWTEAADTPFAEQHLYLYQTFQRGRFWYEYILPFFAPPNESPGIPRGLLQASGEEPQEQPEQS
jgi:HEAT repeats